MTLSVDFDRIASSYRWLEYLSFGPWLERCRFHFLSALKEQRRALIVGDGDGRFGARLLAERHLLEAHFIDGSAKMLALLAQRLKASDHATQVSLHLADALQFEYPGRADLVVTHFVFDCFSDEDAKLLVQRIAPQIEKGGLWLLSEFRIPPSRFGFLAHLLIRLLYVAFRMSTGLCVKRLPDYGLALHSGDFEPLQSQEYLFGILTTQLWRKKV